MFVTLEVSKLSGWLNAVAPCRVERGAYGAARGAGQQTGATASSVQGKLDCRLGATDVERTRNIWNMVVTLEVSQLETSALKNCKL